MGAYDTETLDQIAAELGPEEVARRADALSSYQKFKVLATCYDVTMTPALMAKWAAFAEALAKYYPREVVIGAGNGDNAISLLKEPAELAHEVARNEFYRRQREEKEREEAAAE